MRPGRRILVLDDERVFAEAVTETLKGDGFVVEWAQSIADVTARNPHDYDVYVLDQRLPDGSGMEVVDWLEHNRARAKIVIVTAHPRVDDAVKALRRGIVDYLAKPFDLEHVRLAVHSALRAKEHDAIEADRARRRAPQGDVALRGEGLREVRDLLASVADARSPILVTGETGTGKSLAARTVHELGDPRAPFVTINCAALPEALVEAELFGTERGAFTGAHASRPGLFELADGGTLFLDEIGELAPSMQAKLLHALDDHAVRRIGGARPRPVDVRVVAATNLDLEVAVADRRFRLDLFHRLAVIRVRLSPLRERLGDIEDLVRHHLERLAPGRGLHLADGELARLRSYSWPGNVRELANLLERTHLLDKGPTLHPSRHLPSGAAPPSTSSEGERPFSVKTLDEVERAYVLEVLQHFGGQRNLTAQALGIGVATLRRKLKDWGVATALDSSDERSS